MKGFIKMTKETWRFYLVALTAVLFLMLCDSVYICSDDNVAYGGRIFNYHMEEDSVEEFTKKNAGALYSGKDISAVILDKVHNYEILGFVPTVVIVMIILLTKQFIYMDGRTREFQTILPVKQAARVLHDYLFVFGILLLGEMLQGGIFLAYQTNYNTKLIETAQMFSVTGVDETAVSRINETMLVYMGFYFLFLAVAYTWIYLWMTVTKNPIAGGVISVFLWLAGCYAVDNFLWSVSFSTECEAYMRGEYYWNDQIQDFMIWVESMLSPAEFFGTDELIKTEYSLVQTAGVMTGFLLIMLALILLAGAKRELTNGKLFYFPVLDYPFSLIVGGGVVVLVSENSPVFISKEICVVIGLVAAVLLCMLIHPLSIKKSGTWEVK